MAIAVTVIPISPQSTAEDLVYPSTAALLPAHKASDNFGEQYFLQFTIQFKKGTKGRSANRNISEEPVVA